MIVGRLRDPFTEPSYRLRPTIRQNGDAAEKG
jgi:hypothetical protein